MLKQTITYKNMDNYSVTEDFYFNITSAEMLEREIMENMTWSDKLKAIGETKDPAKILPIIISMVKWAYGVRTVDGKFRKSPDAWEDFHSSEAWDELFMSWMGSAEGADKMVAFVKALMPERVQTQITEVEEEEAMSARQKSEAQMQGHNAPAQPTPVSSLPSNPVIVSDPEETVKVPAPRYDPNTGERLN